MLKTNNELTPGTFVCQINPFTKKHMYDVETDAKISEMNLGGISANLTAPVNNRGMSCFVKSNDGKPAIVKFRISFKIVGTNVNTKRPGLSASAAAAGTQKQPDQDIDVKTSTISELNFYTLQNNIYVEDIEMLGSNATVYNWTFARDANVEAYPFPQECPWESVSNDAVPATATSATATSAPAALPAAVTGSAASVIGVVFFPAASPLKSVMDVKTNSISNLQFQPVLRKSPELPVSKPRRPFPCPRPK